MKRAKGSQLDRSCLFRTDFPLCGGSEVDRENIAKMTS